MLPDSLPPPSDDTPLPPHDAPETENTADADAAAAGAGTSALPTAAANSEAAASAPPLPAADDAAAEHDEQEDDEDQDQDEEDAEDEEKEEDEDDEDDEEEFENANTDFVYPDDAEDIAEHAEFTRLDPAYAQQLHRLTHGVRVYDLFGHRKRRRAQTTPDTDWTKTRAERELAQKQQYTAWEAEGRAWFEAQYAAGVFTEWLTQYTVNASNTIESFGKSYGTAYANQRAYGASFGQWLDEQNFQYLEKATELLWQIQQKKLFDLQCRWRAGQVSLPGVEVVEDFDYWNDRLHRCPFVPPITAEEFALYQAYAATTDFEEDESCDQDYDRYKLEHTGDPGDGGVEMPEWYQFHNAHTGAGALLLLPNTRGERQAHYEKVYQQHRAARIAAQKAAAGEAEVSPPAPPPPPAPADTRPPLTWHDWRSDQANPDRAALDFLRRFADPSVLQHFKAVASTRFDDRADVQEAFDLLLEVRETVTMEPHPDWRQAIQLTAARYRRERTVAALAAVYEEYALREQLGLAHTPYCEYPNQSYALLVWTKLTVLQGRILCGEPATFDY